jgi:hypothetical protein
MDQTLADLEKFWLKVDPDYPFAYDFVDKEYKDRIAVMCKKPVHNTQFCGDPNCTFWFILPRLLFYRKTP